MSGDDTFRAIEAGDADRLKELIEADASLAGARNENGMSAIMSALYRGRMDMVEMLLGAGLELDVFEAASLGRTDRLEAIPKNGARLIVSFPQDTDLAPAKQGARTCANYIAQGGDGTNAMVDWRSCHCPSGAPGTIVVLLPNH